mmetsp:Transcript_23566/g.54175  ORF Transcript_23566/g.54175 Transcript_23566/m.54175 type:complete len:568 (+) Transcript_23566:397-2100(+)
MPCRSPRRARPETHVPPLTTSARSLCKVTLSHSPTTPTTNQSCPDAGRRRPLSLNLMVNFRVLTSSLSRVGGGGRDATLPAVGELGRLRRLRVRLLRRARAEVSPDGRERALAPQAARHVREPAVPVVRLPGRLVHAPRPEQPGAERRRRRVHGVLLAVLLPLVDLRVVERKHLVGDGRGEELQSRVHAFSRLDELGEPGPELVEDAPLLGPERQPEVLEAGLEGRVCRLRVLARGRHQDRHRLGVEPLVRENFEAHLRAAPRVVERQRLELLAAQAVLMRRAQPVERLQVLPRGLPPHLELSEEERALRVARLLRDVHESLEVTRAVVAGVFEVGVGQLVGGRGVQEVRVRRPPNRLGVLLGGEEGGGHGRLRRRRHLARTQLLDQAREGGHADLGRKLLEGPRDDADVGAARGREHDRGRRAVFPVPRKQLRAERREHRHGDDAQRSDALGRQRRLGVGDAHGRVGEGVGEVARQVLADHDGPLGRVGARCLYRLRGLRGLLRRRVTLLAFRGGDALDDSLDQPLHVRHPLRDQGIAAGVDLLLIVSEGAVEGEADRRFLLAPLG